MYKLSSGIIVRWLFALRKIKLSSYNQSDKNINFVLKSMHK